MPFTTSNTGPDHKTSIADLERAGLPLTEENLRYGIPSSMINAPNLMQALQAAAQAEERMPGSAGSKLLGYLNRRIDDLEQRLARGGL